MDDIYYKIYWPSGVGDDQIAVNWSGGGMSVLERIEDASDEGVRENAHIIMDGYEEVPDKVIERYRHLNTITV